MQPPAFRRSFIPFPTLDQRFHLVGIRKFRHSCRFNSFGEDGVPCSARYEGDAQMIQRLLAMRRAIRLEEGRSPLAIATSAPSSSHAVRSLLSTNSTRSLG